jgi:hypothetical protein
MGQLLEGFRVKEEKPGKLNSVSGRFFLRLSGFALGLRADFRPIFRIMCRYETMETQYHGRGGH